MKNIGFWEKQGFIFDENQFLAKNYDISQSEKIFYKKISEKQNSIEDFMRLFDEEYCIEKDNQLTFIQNPISRINLS